MPFMRPKAQNDKSQRPLQKTADESAYRLQVPMFNGMALLGTQGRIGAGEILKLIDIAGCIPAKRHLGANLDPVTASIDRLDFTAPVYPWEMLCLDARITRVWRTSMESRVVVTTWNFRTDETRLVGKAYVLAVGTSNRGKGKADPMAIPDLIEITPEDQLMKISADRRKAYRLQEQLETQWFPIQREESSVVKQQLMLDADGNGLGQSVFGGVILAHMFDVARGAVVSHVGHDSVTCVRQDRMDFKAPTLIGDNLRAKAVVTRTWESSLEVQVDCEAISPLDDAPRSVATTYMVFVGLNGYEPDACVIPEWVPQTDIQRQRAIHAQSRRELREAEAAAFGNVL